MTSNMSSKSGENGRSSTRSKQRTAASSAAELSPQRQSEAAATEAGGSPSRAQYEAAIGDAASTTRASLPSASSWIETPYIGGAPSSCSGRSAAPGMLSSQQAGTGLNVVTGATDQDTSRVDSDGEDANNSAGEDAEESPAPELGLETRKHRSRTDTKRVPKPRQNEVKVPDGIFEARPPQLPSRAGPSFSFAGDESFDDDQRHMSSLDAERENARINAQAGRSIARYAAHALIDPWKENSRLKALVASLEQAQGIYSPGYIVDTNASRQPAFADVEIDEQRFHAYARTRDERMEALDERVLAQQLRGYSSHELQLMSDVADFREGKGKASGKRRKGGDQGSDAEPSAKRAGNRRRPPPSNSSKKTGNAHKQKRKASDMDDEDATGVDHSQQSTGKSRRKSGRKPGAKQTHIPIPGDEDYEEQMSQQLSNTATPQRRSFRIPEYRQHQQGHAGRQGDTERVASGSSLHAYEDTAQRDDDSHGSEHHSNPLESRHFEEGMEARDEDTKRDEDGEGDQDYE